jgi:hypothetical protein
MVLVHQESLEQSSRRGEAAASMMLARCRLCSFTTSHGSLAMRRHVQAAHQQAEGDLARPDCGATRPEFEVARTDCVAARTDCVATRPDSGATLSNCDPVRAGAVPAVFR